MRQRRVAGRGIGAGRDGMLGKLAGRPGLPPCGGLILGKFAGRPGLPPCGGVTTAPPP